MMLKEKQHVPLKENTDKTTFLGQFFFSHRVSEVTYLQAVRNVCPV